MSKLRAAVVGAGGIGRHHVRNYREIDAVDLVAVADINPDVLANVTRGYSTSVYTDYLELLDREKPDLVSIALPTQLHHEAALAAIQRGVNVLVEKPIAMTFEEGWAIIEAARQHSVVLMVGHIERFNPAVAEVKRRLDQRELGRVFQVHARRLSPFPARIQDVGVILDLAPHDIDIMRYLLGAEAERLYAETERKVHRDHEDMLSGLIRFDNGTIGVLDINWLTPTKVRQLQVIGEGGMYLVDYLTQDLYWYKNGDLRGTWDTLTVLRGVWEGDMVKVLINKKEPLRAELEAFVEAVRTGSEPPVSGHDGLVALRLAQKLVEAGSTHQPVAIKPEW